METKEEIEAVLSVIRAQFSFALPLLLLLSFSAGIAHAQTTSFIYQGRLTDGGNPASGNYDLQFALFDSAAAGTQIGSTLARPSVAVSSGAFTVQLDFGVNAFPGADRFLEIGVRSAGGPSFTILSPRQQINSTPYAIRTLGAGTSDALSSACVACVHDSQISSVAASKLTGAIPVASVPSGSTSYVQNTTAQQASSNFNVSGNGILGGTLTANTITAQTGTGFFGLKHTGGSITVGSYVGGSASGASGGWLGTLSNDPLHFFTNSGTNSGQPSMTINPNGNVGIGMFLPVFKFDVAGNLRAAGSISNDIQVETSGGTNAWARLSMKTLNQRWVIGTSQNFNGDQLYLYDDTHGQTRMTIQPNNGVIAFPTGNVGIGTSNPAHRLSLSGGPTWTSNGWTGALSLDNGSAIGWQNNAAGWHFGIGQTNGGLYFFQTSSNLASSASPATYLMTITDGGNVSMSTLQITGGSDLAEHFDVVEGAKPGMLVAIDPQHAGELTIARGAYNRRVAGVISGANHLSAGMVLPNLKDTKKSMPVALTGRVWVYCDATHHAILPGDLLTTSDIPGHAMKVGNYAKARGAIIGKAMTGLKGGRGLVLVLVTLQ